MKLVTINTKLYKKFSGSPELLHNAKRPCVLILKLKYKGRNHDFAVPIRSNVPAASPKNEYFPLPPRSTTRPKNRHGVHYIKMFPIKKEYMEKYHTKGNMQATMMAAILDKNEKQIVTECQQYLTDYENGKRPQYSTDIDYLIKQLEENKKE